jgi:phospholipid/cholesterol/gamma-HCH transport system substrate-binding protein
MFKGNKNLIVGLFVGISIAVFVGFVLWLTGRSGAEEMKHYSMLFQRDVSGLSVGGPVSFMGVNIGSVTGMQLIRRDDMTVRVDIEVLESTPVDGGTFASLAFQGITGVAVINLSSDPGSHPPLELTAGVDYPVIPVRDVGFSALLSRAPKIMDGLDELLAQANKLLGEQNRAAISSTLEDLQAIMSSLAESKETIARLPEELSQVLAGVQETIDQLQGVIRDVQPSLASTMDNVNRTSEKLVSLTTRLDKLVEENEAEIHRFIEEGLGEVPALLNNASQALRELEKLVQELADNPSQLVHRPREDELEIDP